jgi:hypothetical protein
MTRTLSAALTLAALLAACGGDRQQAAGRSDTAVTGASSAAPADRAARADSSAGQATAPAAPAESAAAAAPTDTGAKRPTAGAPEGKKPAAAEAVKAAQSKRDTTGVRPAAQDTGKAAAQAAGSTTTTAQQDQPLRDAYHQAPRDTVDQSTYDGWKQYNLNCARCHGEDALGTTIAPHLIVSLKPDGPINTKELFIQTVCAGRPDKGMPSWCALGMDMDKIQDIYAYVKGRSDAKISPGRPAVKPGA